MGPSWGLQKTGEVEKAQKLATVKEPNYTATSESQTSDVLKNTEFLIFIRLPRKTLSFLYAAMEERRAFSSACRPC